MVLSSHLLQYIQYCTRYPVCSGDLGACGYNVKAYSTSLYLSDCAQQPNKQEELKIICLIQRQSWQILQLGTEVHPHDRIWGMDMSCSSLRMSVWDRVSQQYTTEWCCSAAVMWSLRELVLHAYYTAKLPSPLPRRLSTALITEDTVNASASALHALCPFILSL